MLDLQITRNVLGFFDVERKVFLEVHHFVIGLRENEVFIFEPTKRMGGALDFVAVASATLTQTREIRYHYPWNVVRTDSLAAAFSDAARDRAR
jgi:hypothetical protein